jgi:hypothetical protein
MIIASFGILIGAMFAGGMMEVARKGIFNPQMFNFHEVMIIFLAVMFADIILLDIFNTLGLPTSTTVSIVFELLGAAIIAAVIKLATNGENAQDILNYINSEPFYIKDMFNFIKNASIRNNSNIFSELYLNDEDEIVKELLSKFNIKDIFIIFLVYNNVLDEQYKETGFFADIESTLKDFENVVLKDIPLNKNIEISYEELNKKWENREIVKRNFRDKIEENKQSIINSDALKVEINKVEKTLDYDEFEIKKEALIEEKRLKKLNRASLEKLIYN